MDRKAMCLSLLVAMTLIGCGQPGPPIVKRGGRVVLSGEMARGLLHQCSRGTPPAGDAEWHPSESDLDAFEAALSKLLIKQAEAKEVDFSKLRSGWRGQYAGLVRGGKRFIYGNFFPAETSFEFQNWRSAPAIVCDGGPVFFGAEFDVSTGQVTRVDFNGIA